MMAHLEPGNQGQQQEREGGGGEGADRQPGAHNRAGGGTTVRGAGWGHLRMVGGQC